MRYDRLALVSESTAQWIDRRMEEGDLTALLSEVVEVAYWIRIW